MAEPLRLANAWGLVVHITDIDLLYKTKSSRFSFDDSYIESWRGALHQLLDDNRSLVILETRRVDSLSEDINSRVHAQVHYTQFSQDEVRYVWNNQLSKFEALGISFYHGARDFITNPKMKGRTWNGSEMRRVIGSAVALARPSEWTEEHGEEERKTGPHVGILELEDAVELAGGFGQPDAVEAQGSDDNVTASG
ncbi:hypothetical protein PG989_015414 [Apiospora arundinis]|uniref:P-loop containing nucleoside triphosphate hydrolase protein n=1 Tax=Apiospora arundinis TaxID=335852 RepID=A0ABR2JK32_9PEZI